MPVFRDLTGERFGRLVVISQAPTRNAKVRWLCRCDCGTMPTVTSGNLRSGNSYSCGCFSRERTREIMTTHGACVDRAKGARPMPEYMIWQAMKARCHNALDHHFANYGGRGIIVCDRWRDSFENFLADMGRRPNPLLTIERVDNNGPYTPENCCWASRTAQRLNQRPRRIKHSAYTAND